MHTQSCSPVSLFVAWAWKQEDLNNYFSEVLAGHTHIKAGHTHIKALQRLWQRYENEGRICKKSSIVPQQPWTNYILHRAEQRAYPLRAQHVNGGEDSAIPANKRHSSQSGACSLWLSMTQKCLIPNQTPQERVRFCKLISTTQMLRGHLLSQFSELNQLSEEHPRTRPNTRDTDGMKGQAERQGQQEYFFLSSYP